MAEMTTAALTSLIPVGTFALGLAGSLLTEWLRERWARSRIDDDDRRARAKAEVERVSAFELAGLQSSYDAIHKLMRATVRQHLIDRNAAQAHGIQYASAINANPEAEEVGEMLRLAHLEYSRASMLVLDDRIRSNLQEVVDAVSALNRPMAIASADALLASAILLSENAQREVAARIRAFYRYRVTEGNS